MTATSEQTLGIITEAMGRVSRPYVAFSGGKDSLVVAHMVSQVAPAIPMVYCDDELLFPDHVEYIEQVKARMGDRLRIVQGSGLHRQWFRPWKPGVKWWREPHRDMEALPWVTERNVSPGELASRLGYDSVFLGLRRQESVRRAGILAAATGCDRLNGIWYVNPLLDWSDDDVWAYIRAHGLDYCPVYDRLAEIGVGVHRQRLGPLPLAEGRHLWRGWPRLYIELLRNYGRRWTVPGARLPHDMDMLTWLDLQDVLRD